MVINLKKRYQIWINRFYNPKYIKAYYNRGTVYMNLKNYLNALENFNKTISNGSKVY